MNFDGISGCGTPFSASVSNSVQINATMADLWGQKCNFQYGGRRHLGFSGISILRDLICGLCVKFGANPVKNSRVMAVYLTSRWRPPPSWIFALSEFSHYIWLQDPVFSLRIKFSANICKSGRLMAKNVIFNMEAAAIVNFAAYQTGRHFLYVCQIWCESVQKRPSLTVSKMAAAAILNLLPVTTFVG